MKSSGNTNGFKGIGKIISKAVSITILVILIITALFLAYYAIGSKLSDSKGEKFEPVISLYTIISPSMEHSINPMDVVVTMKVTNPDQIKKGDVITFISTGSLTRGMTITHRVVGIGSDENGVAYTTKGDANSSPDSSPAKFDNVIGKVLFKIPQLGRVQNFLANKGGWLIAIVIPAVIIIISDLIKIFKMVGVKGKLDKIETTEQELKVEQKIKEETRKEDIRKRLKLDKNIYEPDPIKVNKNTRIVVAEKHHR